ncbi:MAG: hypothetical protein HN820_01470 [Candidatus Marinimicrobia bacterium]|nr:hypothetical protein [Candidatus Neomarinimicrobiota bacterium]MBT6871056.1 hypothetical protein [Candidatus Neomarinimicrobiota bacterium]MBT7376806.1 hypothetical protein [Candidatus Neomarinimicrobiota bacterium]
MERTLLFIFFVALAMVGFKFVTMRSGNYDVDFFTKIIGWVLLIPALWGVLESLRIIN